MMGFFMALFAIGGPGSLVAMADPTRARLFPFTMALLWCSLGFWCWLILFGLIRDEVLSETAEGLLFNSGVLLAAIGGALLGFTIGLRRNRRHGIK